MLDGKSWDEKYSGEDYIYGIEPNEFLKANFGSISKSDLLCLGEGEGRNAVFLAKQGYNVTAVDLSVVALRKAKKLADDYGVTIEFIHDDLENYEIGEEKWDGIVSIFCHVPEQLRKKLHKNVVKGLKSTGVFLLESYTPKQLKYGTGGPPSEDLMVSEKILRQDLIGLRFSHLLELDREVVEGTKHFGIGAVVQAIGSKQ